MILYDIHWEINKHTRLFYEYCVEKRHTRFIHWVRSFSFPGSTRCVAVFFSRTNVGSYLHTFVLEKTPPHTGVDPGKLNERTRHVFPMTNVSWLKQHNAICGHSLAPAWQKGEQIPNYHLQNLPLFLWNDSTLVQCLKQNNQFCLYYIKDVWVVLFFPFWKIRKFKFHNHREQI